MWLALLPQKWNPRRASSCMGGASTRVSLPLRRQSAMSAAPPGCELRRHARDGMTLRIPHVDFLVHVHKLFGVM